MLYIVTNQSQRVEYKTIDMPLSVSTILVVIVSKPFSCSSSGAGKIGVQTSRA